MYRHMLCFMLGLFLSACVPQTSPAPSGVSSPQKSAVSGVWRNSQGTYVCLDEDGRLGLPGQSARSGLSWSLQGDVLTLRTLDTPAGQPKEERLGITGITSSRLEIRRADGSTETWRRSTKAVGRLDGTLVYRERMALPPKVLVATQLYLPGSDTPMAVALSEESGQGVLPFRLYYLTKDQADSSEALLRARVFYEAESLFATPEAVPVHLDTSPQIMLQRTLPGESEPAPLTAPIQFRGQTGQNGSTLTLTLHLEPDGLYLLHRESTAREDARPDTVRVGRWYQVDRNHTIQLMRGAEEPLSAALRPGGSLLLNSPDVPGGEMELNPVVEPLPDCPFRVAGMFRMEGDKGFLTECASGLVFSVQNTGAAYSSLLEAYQSDGVQPGDSLFVVCEGTVHYREGVSLYTQPVEQGADDIHVLELVRFEGVYPERSCAEPYAASPLMQTYWRLTSLNGQPSQVFPDQTEPHLILRDDGQAAGSDGCNNFFMQWESSGNTITFLPGGSTLMMCPQGDAQALAYKEALAGADGWSISGSVLELRKDGKPVAIFEAVEL